MFVNKITSYGRFLKICELDRLWIRKWSTKFSKVRVKVGVRNSASVARR